MRIQPLGRILSRPLDQPSDPACSIAYEIASLFQLDGDQCLVVASRDQQGGGDKCVGNDGFIISRLDDIRVENAIPINRPDPDHALQTRPGHAFLAKFPANGAFTPLDAALPDGRSSPAAGTGFLISQGVTFNQDASSEVADSECIIEIMQTTWNGSDFTIASREFVSSLLGFALKGMAVSRYWPLGTGFVVPFTTDAGIIVFRFEYANGRWQAVTHGQPFRTSAEGETEPSVVQAADGRYYGFTRGNDPMGRLYRSDDGLNFELLAARPNNTVPQVLNRAGDGALYLVTNPNWDMLRNPLVAYPVAPDGTFGEGLVIHDQDGIRDAEGPSVPFVDHGIASDVVLEGRGRHLLSYRVCDLRERTLHAWQTDLARTFHAGRNPVERRQFGGIYLAEIHSGSGH